MEYEFGNDVLKCDLGDFYVLSISLQSGYVHSLSTFTIMQEEYCLYPSEDHGMSTLYFCSTEEETKNVYTSVTIG